jgi:hypothetical protein
LPPRGFKRLARSSLVAGCGFLRDRNAAGARPVVLGDRPQREDGYAIRTDAAIARLIGAAAR